MALRCSSVEAGDAGPRSVQLIDGTILDLTADRPAGQSGNGRLSALIWKMLDTMVAQQNTLITQKQDLAAKTADIKALQDALRSEDGDADYASQVVVLKNFLADHVIDRLNTLEQNMYHVSTAINMHTSMLNLVLGVVDYANLGVTTVEISKPVVAIPPQYVDKNVAQTPPPRSDADKVITG